MNSTATKEYLFPHGTMVVSKTDTKGIVTYANEAFSTVSGYEPGELLGQSHSIDRHPDVPKWVFESMWKTLQLGKPWRGVLMNRRKNGEHYWVDAFIVPIRKNGVTLEYLSVRLEASPEQIERAKRTFAAARPPGASFDPSRLLSIKRGVLTGVFFTIVAMLVVVFISQRSLNQSAAAFYELHTYGNVLSALAQTDRHASAAQNQLLLALRHSPSNASVMAADSIDIPQHLAAARRAQNEMKQAAFDLTNQTAVKRYLSGLSATGESPAEATAAAALLRNYVDAVSAYSTAGLDRAMLHIEQGSFGNGESVVVGDLGTLVSTLHDHSAKLGAFFTERSRKHQTTMDQLLVSGPQQMAWWIGFVIIVISLSSVWFFITTMRPLRNAIDAMRRISEGDLTDRLEVDGFGEPGEVVTSLAIMQIHLRVMLDEMHNASANVHTQIGKLNQVVIDILNNTEDAHSQASQIYQTLEVSGADTNLLAASAKKALDLAETLRSKGAQSDNFADDLLTATSEAASLAMLYDFAAEDIRRMSQNINGYLVESRESVNSAWTAGQNLENTSKTLNDMLAKFKQQ